MNKSKIPVRVGVSSLPVKRRSLPVKDKSVSTLPTNSQEQNSNSKQTTKRLLSQSKPIVSANLVEKAPRKMHKEKQRKEHRTISKAEVPLQNLVKKSVKPTVNIIKRVPNNNRIYHKDQQQKRKEHRTISKARVAAQVTPKHQDLHHIVKSDPIGTTQRTIVNKSDENTTAPTKLAADLNLDENDHEFKASAFYKNLILAERKLSPGIIKLCSDAKFSHIMANFDQVNLESTDKKLPSNYLSADELVEQVRRYSTIMHRSKGKLPISPHRTNKDLTFKVMSCNSRSIKENLQKPDLQARSLLHKTKIEEISADQLDDEKPNFRRWTCNALRRGRDIAAEIRRLSEMRRPGFPLREVVNFNSAAKILSMNSQLTDDLVEEVRRNSVIMRKGNLITPHKIFSSASHPSEILNPQERARRELNALIVKKKEKVKKKVTFAIPSRTSLNSVTITKESDDSDIKSRLTDISKGSNQRSTPELETMHKHDKCDNTSQNTTPELNIDTYRINTNLLPKGDMCNKMQQCESRNTTPELDLKTLYNCNEEILPKFCSNTDSLDCTQLDVPFKSVQISDKKGIVVKSLITMESSCENSPMCENKPPERESNSLIQSLEKMSISPSHQQANESKEKRVKAVKKLYTPHPVSLYPNSCLTNSISPAFLPGDYAVLSSLAPICTPYVLKNLAKSKNGDLNPVRQRLTFKEEPKLSDKRRESQVHIQNIPTLQKMFDCLCDQECSILSFQTSEVDLNRNVKDPVASILNGGDEMHFVPIRTQKKLSLSCSEI